MHMLMLLYYGKCINQKKMNYVKFTYWNYKIEHRINHQQYYSRTYSLKHTLSLYEQHHKCYATCPIYAKASKIGFPEIFAGIISSHVESTK